MHLLWIITIITALHTLTQLDFIKCDELSIPNTSSSSSSGSSGSGGSSIGTTIGSSNSKIDGHNSMSSSSSTNGRSSGTMNSMGSGLGHGLSVGSGHGLDGHRIHSGSNPSSNSYIGGSNLNSLTQMASNSTLLSTILNGNGNGHGLSSMGSAIGGVSGAAGSSGAFGGIGLGGNNGLSGLNGVSSATGTLAAAGGIGSSSNGGTITSHHASHGGHPLAGLAGLGIIVPGSNGMKNGLGVGGGGIRRMHPDIGGVGGVGGGGGYGGGDSGGGGMDNILDRMGGGGMGQNPYYEHFISEHTVMAVFTSQGQVGGPCRYMPATRRQNHQCRKELGLPDTIREARRLATTHCEDQFRYDRWNCSIETRGKRNIFKKLYKETAFVHALTAAAMTHSIARACAEGRMTKCSCGPRKQNRVDQDFQWGGCNDNLKHGKRVTRSFLDLRGGDGDEVTEILRHDSEVGIEAVSTLMKDKCKCHGVSGSCSMKTCWKKLSDFNATATLLRQKYNQAIRKAPNTRTMRREAPTSRMKKSKQRRKKQQSQYTTLYYLETSPTYCSVTKDRQCLHPDNCANLCCGRGYTTRVFKQVEKCRCRFNNGRCCQLICDYCQRYEDRYFCK